MKAHIKTLTLAGLAIAFCFTPLSSAKARDSGRVESHYTKHHHVKPHKNQHHYAKHHKKCTKRVITEEKSVHTMHTNTRNGNMEKQSMNITDTNTKNTKELSYIGMLPKRWFTSIKSEITIIETRFLPQY